MLISSGILCDESLRVLFIDFYNNAITSRHLFKILRTKILKNEHGLDASSSYTVKIDAGFANAIRFKIFSRKKRKTTFRLPKTFYEKISWTRAFMEQADRDIEKINKLRKEG